MMTINRKRLEEMVSWKPNVENPNLQQMIITILMGEMRDMAKEIIQLRISLSR